MSISRSAVNVYLFIQHYIYTPFIQLTVEDPKSSKIPTIHIRHKKVSQIVWCIAKLSTVSMKLICLQRIYWINSHWQQYMVTEFAVIVSCTAVFNLTIVTYLTLERHAEEYAYMMRQSFQLLKISEQDFQSFTKFKSRITIAFHQICLYLFAGSFMAFPIAAIMFPFVMDYDPLQFFLWQITPKNISKYWITVVASFCYGLLTIHGTTTALTVILIIIIFGDGVDKISYKLLPAAKMNEMDSNYRLAFNKGISLHRILQILIRLGNKALSDYLAVLLMMGDLLVAGSGYFVILRYHHVPMLAYLAACCVMVLGFATTFLLTEMADVPYRNDNRFKRFWKEQLKFVGRRREIRLGIRSCPQIGFSMVIIRNVQKSTGLTIADNFLNSIANIVLLDGF
ncbi:unnamed protein product [Orchesella dallaii]|uniref:Odorant receptor n=1 Tax=Orchesella dallaii TaxID=48710 RepID=A0ABP1RX54_9HEXA